MKFHERILIGLLFQFFDINFGPIDIIPDFIGYLIIVNAFSKVKAQHAKLGMFSAALLSIPSIIGIVQPEFFAPSANLALQIASIFIGLVTILYMACIFSVSKEILHGEKSLFPTLFISAQLLVQLFTSIGMHLTVDLYEGFLIFTSILLFGFYIYFIVFLWKRKNKENALFNESGTP